MREYYVHNSFNLFHCITGVVLLLILNSLFVILTKLILFLKVFSQDGNRNNLYYRSCNKEHRGDVLLYVQSEQVECLCSYKFS